MVHLRKILIFRNHFRYYFLNKFTVYKGFMLKITYKWWPLTTLNRWTYDRYIELIYIVKFTGRARKWPLYKGDRYDRIDCISVFLLFFFFFFFNVDIVYQYFFIWFILRLLPYRYIRCKPTLFIHIKLFSQILIFTIYFCIIIFSAVQFSYVVVTVCNFI